MFTMQRKVQARKKQVLKKRESQGGGGNGFKDVNIQPGGAKISVASLRLSQALYALGCQ